MEKFIDATLRMSFKHPKNEASEIIQGAQHLKDFARIY